MKGEKADAGPVGVLPPTLKTATLEVRMTAELDHTVPDRRAMVVSWQRKNAEAQGEDVSVLENAGDDVISTQRGAKEKQLGEEYVLDPAHLKLPNLIPHTDKSRISVASRESRTSRKTTTSQSQRNSKTNPDYDRLKLFGMRMDRDWHRDQSQVPGAPENDPDRISPLPNINNWAADNNKPDKATPSESGASHPVTATAHAHYASRFVDSDFGFHVEKLREDLNMSQRKQGSGEEDMVRNIAESAKRHINTVQTFSTMARNSRAVHGLDNVRGVLAPFPAYGNHMNNNNNNSSNNMSQSNQQRDNNTHLQGRSPSFIRDPSTMGTQSYNRRHATNAALTSLMAPERQHKSSVFRPMLWKTHAHKTVPVVGGKAKELPPLGIKRIDISRYSFKYRT